MGSGVSEEVPAYGREAPRAKEEPGDPLQKNRVTRCAIAEI